jgi:hypothetical protein
VDEGSIPSSKEDTMSTIHFHRSTASTPEQFIAGLTDFGPGRSELFPNSADGYLRVHRKGPRDADVTEGSGGIWERLHYDWSDPNHVTLTTTDSNTWGGASGYVYTLRLRPDGTTNVDVVIVREGKNFRGHVLAVVLGTIGKGVLRKAFVHSVTAIETRSDADIRR